VGSSEEESDDGRKKKSQWKKKFSAPLRATGRRKEQIR